MEPSAGADSAAPNWCEARRFEKYGKYFKMLKMGIPLGALENKMKQDGLDPRILDLGGDAMEPSAGADSAAPKTTGVKLADSKKYGKYFKMLKMGIPPGCEKQMKQDGLDPSI